MCYRCVAQKQNSKGTIGREKNHLKSDESELRDKIKEGGVRHTLLVLTCIHIRGSKMFSPAPQSLSLGRWRASELGDDEWQSWEMTSDRAERWRKGERRDDERDEAEMTSVTKQRWRVWGCGGYEQAWAEMTKGTRQRWRVRGSGGCEQAWAEMTKGSLVRWCRVGKDDALICGKFYEWDPVGCMGEIPTPVWVRHQHLYGWDTSIVMDEQTGRHWNGVALNKNVSSV